MLKSLDLTLAASLRHALLSSIAVAPVLDPATYSSRSR